MTTSPPASPAEALTTGWEPDLDLDDSLVRHYVFALAASTLDPVRAMGGRLLERDDVLAGDLGRPAAMCNAAVLTRPPDAGRWGVALDEVERFFAGGSGQAYLWSAWPTPDLRRRGWVLDGHPPLLLRDPAGPLPDAPADLEVRPVRDAATLEDFCRVAVEGFPFDELRPYRPGAWLDPRVLAMPGHELVVGYAGGQAVAAGWLLVHGSLAVPVLGVTLPSARGRGYWTALLVHRLRRAGGRVAATVFSDLSRPIAQRHGFLPVVRFTLWHLDRG